MFENIAQELSTILDEMVERQAPQDDDIFVIGCSTSEVCGKRIGKAGSPAVADALFPVLRRFAQEHNLHLAFQCCEHLNRALIVEHEAVPNGEIVNVLPQPKAGSSFATAAYKAFRHPVALEEIHADAGLDIGGTLIGMHLKKVAVPVRLKQNRIGQAIVLAARTRPKFIGGERAIYDESLKDGYPDFTD